MGPGCEERRLIYLFFKKKIVLCPYFLLLLWDTKRIFCRISFSRIVGITELQKNIPSYYTIVSQSCLLVSTYPF